MINPNESPKSVSHRQRGFGDNLGGREFGIQVARLAPMKHQAEGGNLARQPIDLKSGDGIRAGVAALER